MTAPSDDQLGFAPDDDAPIPYMARTREYYAAIGYTTPYRWAHYVDAPFQPLKKPLGRSRVTIVTTAAPYDPAKGDQGPGAKYNGGAKFYSVYDAAAARVRRAEGNRPRIARERGVIPSYYPITRRKYLLSRPSPVYVNSAFCRSRSFPTGEVT